MIFRPFFTLLAFSRFRPNSNAFKRKQKASPKASAAAAINTVEVEGERKGSASRFAPAPSICSETQRPEGRGEDIFALYN